MTSVPAPEGIYLSVESYAFVAGIARKIGETADQFVQHALSIGVYLAELAFETEGPELPFLVFQQPNGEFEGAALDFYRTVSSADVRQLSDGDILAEQIEGRFSPDQEIPIDSAVIGRVIDYSQLLGTRVENFVLYSFEVYAAWRTAEKAGLEVLLDDHSPDGQFKLLEITES